MWGLSATTDQQIAGLEMKLVAGFYLWGLIVVLFFRWAARHQEAERAGRTVTERDVLTWDAVKHELETVGPPPAETKLR
jgi:hypothetical protein